MDSYYTIQKGKDILTDADGNSYRFSTPAQANEFIHEMGLERSSVFIVRQRR